MALYTGSGPLVGRLLGAVGRCNEEVSPHHPAPVPPVNEELTVTLYELALQLNFRPLTPGDYGDVLTPAHLLFGVTSIRGVLSPSGQELDSLHRRWRHQRLVSEHLVRRWTIEYLQTLRAWSVSPRGRPVRLPKVGEIVLVHAEGSRGRWPLARVISLLSGPDGRSRAALVQIRGRRTRRPVSKLFWLEAQVD